MTCDNDVEYEICNAVYIDCKDASTTSPRIRYFDFNENVKYQSDCLDRGCGGVLLDPAVVKELKTDINKLSCHDTDFESNGRFKKKSQSSYKGGCQAAQCDAIIKEINRIVSVFR